MPDKNKDGVADEAIIIAKDFIASNAVALKDGASISEINRITRLDNVERDLREPPKLWLLL